MEVILVKDIKDLGRLGDTVNVKTGMRLIFFFQINMHYLASAANLKRFEDLSRKELKKRAEEKAEYEVKAKEITGKSLEVAVQTHKGRLYGSFTPNDFIRLAQDELKIELSKRQVVMPDHIKETGAHTIEIALHPDVSAHVNLTIKSDSEVEAPTSFDETEEENAAAEAQAKKEAEEAARAAAAEAKAEEEAANAEIEATEDAEATAS